MYNSTTQQHKTHSYVRTQLILQAHVHVYACKACVLFVYLPDDVVLYHFVVLDLFVLYRYVMVIDMESIAKVISMFVIHDELDELEMIYLSVNDSLLIQYYVVVVAVKWNDHDHKIMVSHAVVFVLEVMVFVFVFVFVLVLGLVV